MSETNTLAEIASLIQQVIGEDWQLDQPVTNETSFSMDLELESIEFVVLAEKIQAHYGQHINFVKWISEMELDRIIALKVGNLVEFIDSCR